MTDATFADGTGVHMVACGVLHTSVLANNNTVWVCGHGLNILGDPVHTFMQHIQQLTRIDPAADLPGDIVLVAVGPSHTVAVTALGRLRTWGRCATTTPVDMRIGRWHESGPPVKLAVCMGMHARLGMGCVLHGRAELNDVLQQMFAQLRFVPRAGSASGFRSLLGLCLGAQRGEYPPPPTRGPTATDTCRLLPTYAD